MKKILLIGLLLTSLTLRAQNNPEEEINACAELASTAESLMQARQAGVDLVKVLEVTQRIHPGGEMDFLVIEAWETPYYSTPSNQQREVTEFKNKIMLQCIKSKR